MLNDKDFVSQMKIKIPEFYQEAIELSNPNARWDYIKYQIGHFSWKISKEKAKQRKAKRIGLESRIKELESSISIKSDSALINEYNECKEKAKQRKAKRIGLESRIKELESSISIKSDSALINGTMSVNKNWKSFMII